jgi:6-phosphogluconolactonase
MLKESLLNNVPIPQGNVHRIQAELGAEAAASAYEVELRSVLPSGDGGMPRLDLVLLGMGDDGHTASLFPHSPGLRETKRWAIANRVEKLGVERITLTYPVLNAAARVAFLVSGASKAPALERVLHGERSIESLPAQGIQPLNGELLWLVDKDAVEGRIKT